jgi:hypothetical protein
MKRIDSRRRRRTTPNSQEQCLAALSKYALIRDGKVWKIGGRGSVGAGRTRQARGFSNETIRGLLDAGLARRVGDRVTALRFANDNAASVEPKRASSQEPPGAL